MNTSDATNTLSVSTSSMLGNDLSTTQPLSATVKRSADIDMSAPDAAIKRIKPDEQPHLPNHIPAASIAQSNGTAAHFVTKVESPVAAFKLPVISDTAYISSPMELNVPHLQRERGLDTASIDTIMTESSTSSVVHEPIITHHQQPIPTAALPSLAQHVPVSVHVQPQINIPTSPLRSVTGVSPVNTLPPIIPQQPIQSAVTAPQIVSPVTIAAVSGQMSTVYSHPFAIAYTNYATYPVPTDDELNKLQLKHAGSIIKSLKRSKEAYLFLNPVDPIKLNIPMYPDIIKTPMDLSTIQKKFDAMEYSNFQLFHRDVELIFDNCITFNGTEAFVSKQSEILQKTYHRLLDKTPNEVRPIQQKKKSLDLRADTSFSAPSSAAEVPRPKRPVSQSYTHAPLSPLKKKSSRKNPGELKFCGSVLRELMNKKHTALNYPFSSPVDAVALGIPQYLQIIQNPMDLSKIKRKLEHGEYNEGDDFEEDVRLMFNNCYTFNRPEDDVYQLGKKLENIFDEKWASKPLAGAPGSYKSRGGDDSSDEENENQQILFLQQSLALSSSQLAVLMDKRRKRKDKRKNEALGYQVQSSYPNNAPVKKPKSKQAKADEKIPEITFEMKKEISEKINMLAQEQIITVFQIIREGMPSLGAKADEEEIELDIDSLDPRTLYRLFKYVKEHTGQPGHIEDEPESSESDSE